MSSEYDLPTLPSGYTVVLKDNHFLLVFPTQRTMALYAPDWRSAYTEALEHIANRSHTNIDNALDSVTVHEPHTIASAAPFLWGVSTDKDGGVIAYFVHEADAHAFRLAYVNRLLNPTANI